MRWNRWKQWAGEPINRVTAAGLVLWTLYLIAEEPWHTPHHTPLYGVPAEFFLKIGYHVAAACGLYARDLGLVQFCAGALALIMAVRLLFWAARPRLTKAQ